MAWIWEVLGDNKKNETREQANARLNRLERIRKEAPKEKAAKVKTNKHKDRHTDAAKAQKKIEGSKKNKW